MGWKPELIGGKVYDAHTWIERIDQNFSIPETCDCMEVAALLLARWPYIKVLLAAGNEATA